MISAQVYQLGLYMIAGAPSNDVGSAYAFPVPFVASKDSTIKFINLPDQGEIRIYTVNGELVKTIRFDAGHDDPLAWDVKNDAGEKVGSDVYLYRIISGSNKKSGKLVIVR
jgi:flagellar hook assembly protein FlgD